MARPTVQRDALSIRRQIENLGRLRTSFLLHEDQIFAKDIIAKIDALSEALTTCLARVDEREAI